MGFLDAFTALARPASENKPVIAADTYYGGSTNTIYGFASTTYAVSRLDAMSVPAVARARNIICSTVGSLPMHRMNLITDSDLGMIPLLRQPDPASPKSVTMAWTADSILFYGVGYWEVLGVYSEDGRPASARWIDPLRVMPVLDTTMTMVIGYSVDGTPRPQSGVGSLIAFNGLDEGLLRRAGRTISTAVALEDAAYRAAQEPTPQMILKGVVEHPASKVSEILTAWKQARQTRATAYIAPGLETQVVGFDPKAQQLVEARQFHASEIARATGIPAWYLNAEMASMTYSNTEQERRTLIDFSLRPILSAIEDRLSMFDITPRDVAVRFDLDDFLRGSMKERADIAVALLNAGIVQVPEARDIVELDAVWTGPND